MAELLFGAETEYAVARRGVKKKRPNEEAALELMCQAEMQLPHLPDMSSSRGMFLSNAARFYVDCGTHPEYATGECNDPWELVRQVHAGHRILASLARNARTLGRRDKSIHCFRSNVDYSGSCSTWAAHENYLYNGSQAALSTHLIPHLVTRPIYAGAGGFRPRSRGLEFTLAPRLTYFEQVMADSTTSGRGIWNDKSESLSANNRRLHVTCSETLCSQTALFLKFGVTALIVAMTDARVKPGEAVQLADPVRALQTVIGDVNCTAKLALRNERSRTAVEIQRHYLEMAEAHLQADFMPSWAGAVCRAWRAILDRIETGGPAAVANTLDWAIKLSLYSHQNLGIRWEQLGALSALLDQSSPAQDLNQDPEALLAEERAVRRKLSSEEATDEFERLARSQGVDVADIKTLTRQRQRMFEIDMRFGELGAGGIFESLDAAGVLDHRIVADDEIERAMTQPPPNGRAKIRGQVVQRLASNDGARCDWHQIIDFAEAKMLDLSDPFAREESWQVLNDTPYVHSVAFERHPLSRRERAYQLFQRGNFSGAEELLRGVVAEEFEVASNRCHLARVLMMMDREPEAREEVSLAWSAREGAASYVVPRILFFRLLFAVLDGQDLVEPIAQIKELLQDSSACSSWTIRPVLTHLRTRLSRPQYRFLKALADALSYFEHISALDEFPEWRTVQAAAATPG